MIYNLWNVIFDMWYMFYDIWFMVYDIWYLIFDFLICDIRIGLLGCGGEGIELIVFISVLLWQWLVFSLGPYTSPEVRSRVTRRECTVTY